MIILKPWSRKSMWYIGLVEPLIIEGTQKRHLTAYFSPLCREENEWKRKRKGLFMENVGHASVETVQSTTVYRSRKKVIWLNLFGVCVDWNLDCAAPSSDLKLRQAKGEGKKEEKGTNKWAECDARGGNAKCKRVLKLQDRAWFISRSRVRATSTRQDAVA